MRIATAGVRTGFAMTPFTRGAECGRRRGGGTPPYAFHGVRCKAGRVVREADPYGSVTGRASGIGRGRTPPLRRVTRGTVKRGVEDAAPYGGVTRSACVRADVGSELSAASGR